VSEALEGTPMTRPPLSAREAALSSRIRCQLRASDKCPSPTQPVGPGSLSRRPAPLLGPRSSPFAGVFAPSPLGWDDSQSGQRRSQLTWDGVGRVEGLMIALLITVTASAPTAMSSVIIGLFSPSRRLASCVPIRTFERRQFRQVSPKRRVGWNFDLPAVGRIGIPANCACCVSPAAP